MLLNEYIAKVVQEFVVAEGKEIPGTKDITFDIGVTPRNNTVYVDDSSLNRVKFTLQVERS